MNGIRNDRSFAQAVAHCDVLAFLDADVGGAHFPDEWDSRRGSGAGVRALATLEAVNGILPQFYFHSAMQRGENNRQ